MEETLAMDLRMILDRVTRMIVLQIACGDLGRLLLIAAHNAMEVSKNELAFPPPPTPQSLLVAVNLNKWSLVTLHLVLSMDSILVSTSNVPHDKSVRRRERMLVFVPRVRISL